MGLINPLTVRAGVMVATAAALAFGLNRAYNSEFDDQEDFVDLLGGCHSLVRLPHAEKDKHLFCSTKDDLHVLYHKDSQLDEEVMNFSLIGLPENVIIFKDDQIFSWTENGLAHDLSYGVKTEHDLVLRQFLRLVRHSVGL